MSSFMPKKRNVRETLHFCLHLMEPESESRRLLSKAYEVYAPSIVTCKHKFGWFKDGDFDMNDKSALVNYKS